MAESGAQVDAGYRRRFLLRAARRGARLRAQEVRRRSRRADHHVRHDQGQAGDSRRRPRARTVVRRDRPNRQAVSGAQAGPRFPAERRARDGAAAQGRAQDCIPIFSTTRSSSKGCCAMPRAMRPASSFPIVPLTDLVPLYVDKERDRGRAGDHAVLDEGRRGDRAHQVRLPRAQEPDADSRHAQPDQAPAAKSRPT